MICTACQKAQAVLFVKQVSQNKVTQAALCSDCALEGPEESPAPDFLLQMLAAAGSGVRPRGAHPRCGCGTRWADFQRTGRFGCPDCYSRFEALLAPSLPRIHAGAWRHRGKHPKGR